MNGSELSRPASNRPSRQEASSRPPQVPKYNAIWSGSALESILRLAEEQGQFGFWWKVPGTRQVFESPGLARILGVPSVERRPVDDLLRFVHPQDRPLQADQVNRARAGQSQLCEFRILRLSGAIRWVSSRVTVDLDDSGEAIRYVGVLVDITERREAQQGNRVETPPRAVLLDAISALTWIGDSSGEAVDYGGWCALTGMAPEHCSGDGWLDAVHPNDRQRVGAAHRSAVANGSIYNTAFRVLKRDGRYGWFNARSTPVRDASGSVREWYGVVLPIDDEHRPTIGDIVDIDVGPLTGAQIRGARGLLDWSLAQLAFASGVSVSTIKRMEDGKEGTTRASKSDAVRRALETGGVRFRIIDGATWLSR